MFTVQMILDHLMDREKRAIIIYDKGQKLEFPAGCTKIVDNNNKNLLNSRVALFDTCEDQGDFNTVVIWIEE